MVSVASNITKGEDELNLYFKTSNFNSNSQLADYMFNEFKSLGLNPTEPKCEEFMCFISTTIENQSIVFYMGKNDEPSNPTLWQIWPERKNPLFSRIFGKADQKTEHEAKAIIERIVNNIQSVSSVEWGI